MERLYAHPVFYENTKKNQFFFCGRKIFTRVVLVTKLSSNVEISI